MQQLSPKEIKAHIEQSESKPVLLDVREPHELAICAIEGAINIPLGHIPARYDELDPQLEYVLICHHGMRSMRAGMFLREQGFEQLINMDGGIDAWAAELDPAMARY